MPRENLLLLLSNHKVADQAVLPRAVWSAPLFYVHWKCLHAKVLVFYMYLFSEAEQVAGGSVSDRKP